MTTSPFLEVRGLTAHYGPIAALKGISLRVNRGEIVSLLGGNGAGKFTTLMSVCGIHTQSSGEINFDGVSLRKIPAHKIVEYGLCQVPEGRRIFSRLTVHENLLLGAYRRSDRSEMSKDEEYIYSLFPVLKERKKQFGGTLSGGEQQMLAIGRALMSKPKMLLLDEPSMGIAPLLVKKIFEALFELNKKGLTILLIEQNANAALKLSERAYVMETGEITIEGRSEDLLKDSRIQEAYLGS